MLQKRGLMLFCNQFKVGFAVVIFGLWIFTQDEVCGDNISFSSVWVDAAKIDSTIYLVSH